MMATSPDGVHWTKANDGQPVTGLDGSPPHKAHIGLMEATLPSHKVAVTSNTVADCTPTPHSS